ncbi:MAG: hypothetical protein IJ713_01255 [Oscillibacter sp.]|nr:hypothetical protein [Oscillibacter sp.]
MSEILVHLHIDVWKSEKPEVSWVRVTRRTNQSIKYEVRTAKKGGLRVEERSLSRRWIGRVNPDWRHPNPCGVVDMYWCQDDREPIHGGMVYNMAMIDAMARIDADMQAAAIRVREMKEALYEGGGIE